MVIDKQKA